MTMLGFHTIPMGFSLFSGMFTNSSKLRFLYQIGFTGCIYLRGGPWGAVGAGYGVTGSRCGRTPCPRADGGCARSLRCWLLRHCTIQPSLLSHSETEGCDEQGNQNTPLDFFFQKTVEMCRTREQRLFILSVIHYFYNTHRWAASHWTILLTLGLAGMVLHWPTGTRVLNWHSHYCHGD